MSQVPSSAKIWFFHLEIDRKNLISNPSRLYLKFHWCGWWKSGRGACARIGTFNVTQSPMPHIQWTPVTAFSYLNNLSANYVRFSDLQIVTWNVQEIADGFNFRVSLTTEKKALIRNYLRPGFGWLHIVGISSSVHFQCGLGAASVLWAAALFSIPSAQAHFKM